MKLYMAGPLFTIGERAFNVQLKEQLESYGHEVWLPQEHEPREKSGKAIFLMDMEGLKWAECVVACMDQADPDSGTCFECGWAYERKPIVIYRTDFRNIVDFTNTMTNLMLTESANEQVKGYLGMTVDAMAGEIDAALRRIIIQ